MTRAEFATLFPPPLRVPDLITPDLLADRGDRTLLRGRLFHGSDWHVFLRAGQILAELAWPFAAEGDYMAGLAYSTERRGDPPVLHSVQRMGKSAYGRYELVPINIKLDPAACDLEFCRLLQHMRVLPSFAPFPAPTEETIP